MPFHRPSAELNHRATGVVGVGHKTQDMIVKQLPMRCHPSLIHHIERESNAIEKMYKVFFPLSFLEDKDRDTNWDQIHIYWGLVLGHELTCDWLKQSQSWEFGSLYWEKSWMGAVGVDLRQVQKIMQKEGLLPQNRWRRKWLISQSRHNRMPWRLG